MKLIFRLFCSLVLLYSCSNDKQILFIFDINETGSVSTEINLRKKSMLEVHVKSNIDYLDNQTDDGTVISTKFIIEILNDEIGKVFADTLDIGILMQGNFQEQNYDGYDKFISETIPIKDFRIEKSGIYKINVSLLPTQNQKINRFEISVFG